MEQKGTLRRSQQHATCPYPKPNQSSTRPLSYFSFKIHFNNIPPTPSFPPTPSMYFSSSPHAPHARPSLLLLMWSPELHLVTSTGQRTSSSGIRCDSGNFLPRTPLHGVTTVRDKTHSILASWSARMIFHSALHFLSLFIYIFSSELTNYSMNCCHT